MSINANELRIGNMVLYSDEDGKKYCTIRQIHETVVAVDGKEWGNLGKSYQHFDKIEGIPLSVDVLKKCGFTFDDHGRLFYNGLRVSSSFVRWEPAEGWIQLDSPIGTTTIKSVHHLQNWFFALTQQELNVNL
jgi:hypothetical protein